MLYLSKNKTVKYKLRKVINNFSTIFHLLLLFEDKEVAENFFRKDCAVFGCFVSLWEKVEMRHYFSGSSVAKLDEKGRFVLPQELRYGLIEEGKCEFVLGLGLGGCLAIYRRSGIDAIVEKFREKQHVAQYQKFFTFFFSTLHQTECDKIGRTAVPPMLRSAVGIQKEIVVAGVLDKIELWPKEVYDRNLSSVFEGDMAKMTEEAFALLGKEEHHSEKGANPGILERVFPKVPL